MTRFIMKRNSQIVIIGAGAAGLMCAITAAKRGRKVIIIDHANKAGKKILMSGGGRCNFTNYSIEIENYLCSNPHFCKSALSRYTQWDFIALVEEYNIEYYDKGLGQLFCRKSSKEILNLLLCECERYGVEIILNESVVSISNSNELNGENDKSHGIKSRLSVQTKASLFSCESVVIATGGLSIPTMGATGFGYDIAEQFSHQLVTTRPSLSPLTFDKKWLEKTKNLPGNSVMVRVSCGNQSFLESMLFTHKGLSGPAILQISNYWKPGQALIIDLLPAEAVENWLQHSQQQRGDIQLKTLLTNKFSQAIAEFLCHELAINKKLKQLDHADREKIVGILTQMKLYPSGYEGYRVAEVTKGGVNTDEVSSKTFESKNQPGLYFIGEVLDVTGHLGGYNFQWAWSSGFAAGSYA
jgi:predicted Rossmann fold flavoprotein